MIEPASFPVMLLSLPLMVASGQGALSAKICGCEDNIHMNCMKISGVVLCLLHILGCILLAMAPAAGLMVCCVYSVLSVLSAGVGIETGSAPVCSKI